MAAGANAAAAASPEAVATRAEILRPARCLLRGAVAAGMAAGSRVQGPGSRVQGPGSRVGLKLCGEPGTNCTQIRSLSVLGLHGCSSGGFILCILYAFIMYTPAVARYSILVICICHTLTILLLPSSTRVVCLILVL